MTAQAEHGYRRYSSRTNPCRCDVCRAAKATYVRERRRAGLEPMRTEVKPPAWNQRAATGRGAKGKRVGISRFLLPNATHGTATGYRKGCRCWDCTDAYSARRLRTDAA